MAIPTDFTPRCRAFLAELDALCACHGVRLTLSGAARLQVWRAQVEDTGGFALDNIDDRTEEEREP